jgi:hypothetical protein
MKNVIILTSGLSGSSVLTGLIARAGYWTGDAMFKKKDYATFENADLIQKNLEIINQVGYKGSYLEEFAPEVINAISTLHTRTDLTAYRAFVEHCNEHQPWIWKDPRLWMTIRFWKNVLDLRQCQFILLTRRSLPIWISSVLRRQIMSFRFSRKYEGGIKQSITDFLQQNQLSYLHVEYDELILKPAETIEKLNRYLGTSLTVNDLKGVYHEPLYQAPGQSWTKLAKAVLIYLKNYSERLDVT